MKNLIHSTFIFALLLMAITTFGKSSTLIQNNSATINLEVQEDAFDMGIIRDSLLYVRWQAGPFTGVSRITITLSKEIKAQASMNGDIKTTPSGWEFIGSWPSKFNNTTLQIEEPIFMGTTRQGIDLYMAPGRYLIRNSISQIPLMSKEAFGRK